MGEQSQSTSRNWTRRSVLIAAAVGGGAAGAAALSSSGGGGNLYGGTMALEEAFNVAGNLWIGPASALEDVDPNSGRVFMAVDEEIDYYGTGSDWDDRNVGSAERPVGAVHTESADITGEGVNEFPGGTDHQGSDASGISELHALDPRFENAVELTNGPVTYGNNHGTVPDSSIAIGRQAVAPGSHGVSIGDEAGPDSDETQHVTIGRRAATGATGGQITAIGAGAFRDAGDVGLSVAIGPGAGREASASNQVFIGQSAGQNLSGSGNVLIGRSSGGQSHDDCVYIGDQAGRDATGDENVSIGWFAGQDSTGDAVSAVGDRAAFQNDGNDLTAIGQLAGRENTGHGVIALGTEAARDNIEDDILVVSDRNGNARMKLDLTNGDLILDGSLTEDGDPSWDTPA